MTTTPSSRPEKIQVDSAYIYPLPHPWDDIGDRLEEEELAAQEEALAFDPAEAMREELDRIFGPDNTEGSEQIDNLIRWILDTEQRARVERALAEPFEMEAARHHKRAYSLESRALWLKERLLSVVQVRGGKFSGIRKVSVRAGRKKVSIAGSCTQHPGDHYEQDDCVGFRPISDFPEKFLRIKVEANKIEIARALEGKTEGAAEIGDRAILVDGRPWVSMR